MPVSLYDLRDELDAILEPERFSDYCPNGLQVQGRDQVSLLVTGVTACQGLINAAIEMKADALLVHHGYFWKGEPEPIVGMKRRRIAALLAHDISLLAYHLPLDAHPRFGNNASLARLLDIEVEDTLEPGNPAAIGNVGQLARATPVRELLDRIGSQLGREALHIGDPADSVRRVAWCSGGAQGYIEQAVAAQADVFITGEVSEQTVHVAREEGIHFIAAGHHATERYGVQSVGSELMQRLDVTVEFVDIDNPV